MHGCRLRGLAFCLAAGWLSLSGQIASAAVPRAVSVGNWSVRPQANKDMKQFDRCSASSTNATGVAISYVVNRNFIYRLAFSSPAWSFTKGSSFSIALKIGDSGYLRRHAVVSDADTLELEFVDSIALFHRLRMGGKLQVLAGALSIDFDLTGSNEALPALFRCIAQVAGPAMPSRVKNPVTLPAGTLQSPGNAANRTEAAALAAEIIDQTGVVGAQALQRGESPPGLRADYAWRAGPLIGTVLILQPETIDINDLPRALINSDGRVCAGNFFLVSAPETIDQSPVARIFTSCQLPSAATVSTFYLAVPRTEGGLYVLATNTVGVELASDKQLLTEFDERLRSTIMAILAKLSRAAPAATP
jgi:hypothetical protein